MDQRLLLPFPLAHSLRTVLAVQGSLRRACRRALDGSGPFGRTHPLKREREKLETSSRPRPSVGRPRNLSYELGWEAQSPLRGEPSCAVSRHSHLLQQTAGRRLDAMATFRRLPARRGNISLDIPFYRITYRSILLQNSGPVLAQQPFLVRPMPKPRFNRNAATGGRRYTELSPAGSAKFSGSRDLGLSS